VVWAYCLVALCRVDHYGVGSMASIVFQSTELNDKSFDGTQYDVESHVDVGNPTMMWRW